MVYYLKYRPQSLSNIVGQKQVKDALMSAFLNKKLAHAYLFCGLRGTGKTSTARILAKMVNCEKKTEDLDEGSEIPCNRCQTCISITQGSNLDLIEIDAASNRGINDIRDLRERIKLAPTASHKKVYIIDEAHMLTTEAFNALLKTLEEPPEHVLFILATTEPSKIPQTILSRVQRLDFKQATTEDLVFLLEKIAKKEKINIDSDAIKLLAKKGDGSFRDVLKLLEQLSVAGETITLAAVEKNLLSGSFEDVISLLEFTSKKDTQKALEFIGEQFKKGVNIQEYLMNILDVLRDMLLIKHNVLISVKEDLGSARFEMVSGLAGVFSVSDLISQISFFQQALATIKSTSHQTLTFEIAVIECCQDQKPETVDVITSPSISPEVNSAKQPNPGAAASVMPPFPRDTKVMSDSAGIPNSDMPKLLDKWTYVLETIKPYNYSLEALLKQAKVLSCDKGQVMLEVPYSFHQRILEAPKNKTLLESVLSDVLEREIRVSCVLGVRPVRVEEVTNIELAADDEVIRIAAEIFNSEPVN